MLVQIKKGLESGYKSRSGDVFIVSAFIEPPYRDDKGGESGSTHFLRTYDIRVMSAESDGRCVEFAVDSRFFEPYTGEVA
jgi:hypothetical protein